MFYLRFFLLLFCASQFAQAQQFPLDFENNQYPFTGFSGSSFSFVSDPVQTTNNVGEFFNNGTQATQGFYIDVNNPVDLSADPILTLRFYAFDPNTHTVLLKLENGNQPDIEMTQQIAGGANNWNDVNFNFSNSTGQYSRVTIFIDYGAAAAGTYLIDDINNGATPPNPIDVVYTDLVWSDEFDTTGTNNPIDATKWFHQTQLPSGGNWFNGEQQHYTDRLDNSYVENGFLNIVAKRESFTDQGQTKQFTSARLNSKYAFTYGRVDVRAKLPFGDGTWPAIWTLGKNINEDGGYWDSTYGTTNWPLCGEIDIMEHGLGALNHVSAALHTNCAGCSGNTRNFQSTTLQDVANDFHVYSMNWSPQQITFLIDDVPFYIYNPAVKNIDTYPFYEDQYFLLNVAMGGIAGSIDPNFIQSSMVIDYVRVYQNTLSIAGENTNESDLKIYPNPATDVVNLETSQAIDRVDVFALSGQLLVSETEETNSLDISTVKTGIYILKVYSSGIIINRKLVVQ
ncbi:family 16 glycosylhydrolase [Nonlabens sp. Ci31]|jgi:beta-glucanase (GH16 family)|uniref:family 16 glycosylhydrolase n=1 Tax=Nonlabens sp. Ci31 TaxID=2608253 RepID=UPI001463F418|nr:family 16 glycosylhydrolase [Nonlabens sp. Ci31]QJP33554.1 family 16 glycosylhydrolase [Nonlabens sp. Ci31]